MRVCLIIVSAIVVGAHASGPAQAQTFPADAAWRPFFCGAAPMNDPVRDQSGAVGERDLVGTGQAPAGFRAVDDQFLFLRLRLDDTPEQGNALRPFAWGFAFSTDGDPTTYEVLATIDGATQVVQLFRNSSTTVPNSPEDPADAPAVASFPFATHGRTVAADSSQGGNRDHFLDFALPWTNLEALGVSRDRTVAVWAASSTNVDRLNGDFACHDGRGGTAVPRLGDADSDPQRADGAGGSGAGGNGGTAGAGGSAPSTVTIEGGPGCSMAGTRGSGAWLALMVLLSFCACQRRRERRR